MLIKSKMNAIIILLIGLSCIVCYKIVKIYIFRDLNIAENSNYYQFQQLCTYARLFFTVVAIGSIYAFIEKPTNLFFKKNSPISKLYLYYLLIYFLIKCTFYTFNFTSYFHFSNELFFNFFTGTFEEFVFRGLILVGLRYFLNFWPSVLISSFMFSAWHYDVIVYSLSYLDLFIIGIIHSIALARGINLATVAVSHFLFDQIHFSFFWEGIPSGASWFFVNIIFGLVFLYLFIFMGRKKWSTIDIVNSELNLRLKM